MIARGKSLTVVPDAAGCCPPKRLRTPKKLAGLAPLFKALGDETRLAIVALLAAADGEVCVCDVERHFELSQPTISHHLKVLREAGLVRSERRGTWVYYELERRALAAVERLQALAVEP